MELSTVLTAVPLSMKFELSTAGLWEKKRQWKCINMAVKIEKKKRGFKKKKIQRQGDHESRGNFSKRPFTISALPPDTNVTAKENREIECRPIVTLPEEIQESVEIAQ